MEPWTIHLLVASPCSVWILKDAVALNSNDAILPSPSYENLGLDTQLLLHLSVSLGSKLRREPGCVKILEESIHITTKRDHKRTIYLPRKVGM
ncbi:hypothetical protein HD806DRAFT_491553 [Xylariaceae sp. AK1471]|nr:hypothetical protein HD806DRAFT_491553 [Xylariaceae sp. AK1471]